MFTEFWGIPAWKYCLELKIKTDPLMANLAPPNTQRQTQGKR